MVTITDIAEALGITPSTVSRALAGSPRVKEETRLAVEKAAEQMGYERNVIASNLRRGRSDMVGIIVPRVNREFFSNVIGGAESILEEAGYRVLICQTHESRDSEIKAIRSLRNNRVAAVIMSHAIEDQDGEHIIETLGKEIPLVQFDRVFHNLPGAKVVGTNFQGAYEATKHLIDNGYRRIGALAGYMTSDAYANRLDGYRKALADSGMEVDESIIFYDTIVRETGYEAGLKAVDLGCDALYSSGDFSALGAVEAVTDRGLSIPRDFGIVGTANEIFTSLMRPTLSSVGQYPYEMGQRAASAFLSGEGEVITIPTKLIVRESSNRNSICQK